MPEIVEIGLFRRKTGALQRALAALVIALVALAVPGLARAGRVADTAPDAARVNASWSSSFWSPAAWMPGVSTSHLWSTRPLRGERH